MKWEQKFNIWEHQKFMKRLLRRRVGLEVAEALVAQVQAVKQHRPDPYFYLVRDADEPWHAFKKFLERKGFKVLGGGAFSTVMGKDGSDRVLKIIRNPSDNWLEYVTWAAKQGFAGNLAPKVYSYKFMKGFGVASMERLEKTLSKVPLSEPMGLAHGLFHYGVKLQNDKAFEFLETMIPGVTSFGEAIRTKFDGFDLHLDNYMLRKDGSFVVTDPVAGKSTMSYNTRLRARDFLASSASRFRNLISCELYLMLKPTVY